MAFQDDSYEFLNGNYKVTVSFQDSGEIKLVSHQISNINQTYKIIAEICLLPSQILGIESSWVRSTSCCAVILTDDQSASHRVLKMDGIQPLQFARVLDEALAIENSQNQSAERDVLSGGCNIDETYRQAGYVACARYSSQRRLIQVQTFDFNNACLNSCDDGVEPHRIFYAEFDPTDFIKARPSHNKMSCRVVRRGPSGPWPLLGPEIKGITPEQMKGLVLRTTTLIPAHQP